MKISRKGDYGLLLLTSLAREGKGKVVSLRRLAKQKGMPFKYLSQIAPILVEARILGSREGASGGYYLIPDPKKVSLEKILELLEGPIAPVACMRGGCSRETGCSQKKVWVKMAGSLKEAMKDYTLADLVESGEAG